MRHYEIFYFLTFTLLLFVIVSDAISQVDMTPPTFTNFVIDTPTIDTTGGPDTVRFTVEGVQDDLSGVIGVFVTFNNPDGTHNGTAVCSLDTGTSLNGTWKCERTLPQFSQGGTYELVSGFALELIDDLDNRARFSKSDLDTLGFDTTFVNTATNFDNTPPTFTNFMIDTPVIHTINGPDTVRFTVEGVQDDISGVIGVFVTFNNPDGTHNGTAVCSLDTGTSLNGTWKCERTLPQFSQGGTYELVSGFALELIDDLDNRARFSKSDLDTLGFDTTFVNDILCGNGLVDNSEECDLGADNGANFSCCTMSCEFAGDTTECREASGICDIAEFCNGGSSTCPDDVFVEPGSECRASVGSCDLAEMCDGINPECPADILVGAGVECREATDICDLPETCTGATATCPPPDSDHEGSSRLADENCDIGGELVSTPTLSEWGLIALAGILGIVGFIVISRKKATA